MDGNEVKVYSMNASILIRDTLCARLLHALPWKKVSTNCERIRTDEIKEVDTHNRRTACNQTNECGVCLFEAKNENEQTQRTEFSEELQCRSFHIAEIIALCFDA